MYRIYSVNNVQIVRCGDIEIEDMFRTRCEKMNLYILHNKQINKTVIISNGQHQHNKRKHNKNESQKKEKVTSKIVFNHII